MSEANGRTLNRVVGRCMRCGEQTTRIVLVGCVCERCATEVDIPEQARKLKRAAAFLLNRIQPNAPRQPEPASGDRLNADVVCSGVSVDCPPWCDHRTPHAARKLQDKPGSHVCTDTTGCGCMRKTVQCVPHNTNMRLEERSAAE